VVSAINMAWEHGGPDFQSRFDKSTAQAEQMKAGALRVLDFAPAVGKGTTQISYSHAGCVSSMNIRSAHNLLSTKRFWKSAYALREKGHGLHQGVTKSFHNGSYLPALTTYEYKGYIIGGWARPEFMNGLTSVGVVYKRDELGSIILVQRIVGESFESKEQAEQRGLELCKEWIDTLTDIDAAD
jgi:hypothetical protein